MIARLARFAPALAGAALLMSGAAYAQATATKTTTARHYDCTKAGNANKAACKGAAGTAVPAAAPAPAAPPVAATTRTTAIHTATTSKTTTTMKGGDKPTNAGGPNGATAQCKDGTYSKSTHHSGTCAGHKGVATWY